MNNAILISIILLLGTNHAKGQIFKTEGKSTNSFETNYKYSFKNEHLRILDEPDLYRHYKKAKSIKNTGLIMLLSGPAIAVGGVVRYSKVTRDNGGLAIVGVLVTMAAIPVTIAGTTRIKRVKTEYYIRDIPISFKISPAIIQMPYKDNVTAGMNFTISF